MKGKVRDWNRGDIKRVGETPKSENIGQRQHNELLKSFKAFEINVKANECLASV